MDKRTRANGNGECMGTGVARLDIIEKNYDSKSDTYKFVCLCLFYVKSEQQD
jgi:hypothetical protein